MRDLVETVIGQVMKQKPTIKPFIKSEIAAEPTKTFHVSRVQSPLEIKDKDMWKACCQFESVFLQQMMAAMRKTVPESEFLPRGYANDMYDGMMDQAIAESGSKNAPLGLAISMYRQLDRDGFTQAGSGAAHAPTQALQEVADRLKMVSPVDKPSSGDFNGSY